MCEQKRKKETRRGKWDVGEIRLGDVYRRDEMAGRIRLEESVHSTLFLQTHLHFRFPVSSYPEPTRCTSRVVFLIITTWDGNVIGVFSNATQTLACWQNAIYEPPKMATKRKHVHP